MFLGYLIQIREIRSQFWTREIPRNRILFWPFRAADLCSDRTALSAKCPRMVRPFFLQIKSTRLPHGSIRAVRNKRDHDRSKVKGVEASRDRYAVTKLPCATRHQGERRGRRSRDSV